MKTHWESWEMYTYAANHYLDIVNFQNFKNLNQICSSHWYAWQSIFKLTAICFHLSSQCWHDDHQSPGQEPSSDGLLLWCPSWICLALPLADRLKIWWRQIWGEIISVSEQKLQKVNDKHCSIYKLQKIELNGSDHTKDNIHPVQKQQSEWSVTFSLFSCRTLNTEKVLESFTFTSFLIHNKIYQWTYRQSLPRGNMSALNLVPICVLED